MKTRFILGAFIWAIIFSITLPLEIYASHRSGYSSTLRRKISALDDDRVENVPVPILMGVTPDNITKNFGAPRSGGRTHEGLDIMAPRGAPIVTPTDAVVIQVGRGDSAGYYVYTANPGDEVFAYMHLDQPSELDEGDVLKKGDLIGFVGNTGNAINTPPHLHFEMREDGDEMDPYPRLTRIFPLADKIKYLEEIINDTDEDELNEFITSMVQLYRSEFILARGLAIPLPDKINIAIAAPITTSVARAPTEASLNLTLGARGVAVVALQNFLISKNIGSGGRLVADGSFGRMTQTALAEYQAYVGISPASGYFGPITRAYIVAHP